MIVIKDKEKCCGCNACQQICPQHCIRMEADEQGFLYPFVDEVACVNCHLCENVCPVLNRYTQKDAPICSYLAKTKDDTIRVASSSGGVFTVLATHVLDKGGVVFGVRFDKRWMTVYDYTETKDKLCFFRGSKYVQACPHKAYNDVLRFLKEGRLVLFTGTPCFISGLNHFLKKKYDNLLTLDVVCHSIPSPKVWSYYISEIEKTNKAKVSYVTFRDKSNGWTNYSIRLEFEDEQKNKRSFVETHDDNVYMRGFLHDLYTRPSCSECPARNYTSGSDITIADAWDINKYHPEKNDEEGISHILINTEKGNIFLEQIKDLLICEKIDYSEVEPYTMHAPITKSSSAHPYRKVFYKKILSGSEMIPTTIYLLSRYERITILKNRIRYSLSQIKIIRFFYKLVK